MSLSLEDAKKIGEWHKQGSLKTAQIKSYGTKWDTLFKIGSMVADGWKWKYGGFMIKKLLYIWLYFNHSLNISCYVPMQIILNKYHVLYLRNGSYKVGNKSLDMPNNSRIEWGGLAPTRIDRGPWGKL